MKRNEQRTSSLAAAALGAVCISCLLVGGVGFGVASADRAVPHDGVGLGISAPAPEASQESAASSLASEASDKTAHAQLASSTTRNISKGIEDIAAEEEAARLAEEEAKRANDQRHADAAYWAWEQQLARDATAAAVDLDPVDWSVGEEAFLAEWTQRIDAYLVGSPLAGYGALFAQASWDYGVDPRFSPAISNTESSKGKNCFRSHNAWGWMGDTVWSSWEESIFAHVKGLSDGYGYTVSLANAKKYCPPTYEDWYGKTIAQMRLI